MPEYKLRLIKPIDKYLVDSRLGSKKSRYMRTIRVDVGFIKEGKLPVIGKSIHLMRYMDACPPKN